MKISKSILIGTAGGILFFFIFIIIIMSNNPESDDVTQNNAFDQKLTQSMDKNISTDLMQKEIEDDTARMRKKIIEECNSNIINPKLWGNGDLVTEEELNFYANNYDMYMDLISEYDRIRKQYVKREISKDEFLQKAYELNHL